VALRRLLRGGGGGGGVTVVDLGIVDAAPRQGEEERRGGRDMARCMRVRESCGRGARGLGVNCGL
jgi:hypothetical protein